LSRYRKTIEWSGTIGNLERVKHLHRRLAAANRSSYDSVPLLLALPMTKHLMLALALIGATPATAAEPEHQPYFCHLLDDEQRKCSFGSSDPRTLNRLRKECRRDGGRPI